MPQLPSFVETLSRDWPLAAWSDVNVVVAVSGGRDSVALLHALHQLRQTADTPPAGILHVAHLNHRLRGSDSEADERFVRQLCEDLSLPLDVQQADVAGRASQAGDGIEAAARDARYEFLREAAGRRGARYLATGHTRDDQVETILHRILRGTGIAGLSGMPSTRPLGEGLTLVRPLLQISREEVDDYIRQQQIAFREDQSNADERFTRNRLRNDLLPKLRAEFNPAVDEALWRLGELAGECHGVIDTLASQVAADCVEATEDSITIHCAVLGEHPPYLIRQMLVSAWAEAAFPLQHMTSSAWKTLAEMAQPNVQRASQTFPGNIQAERRGDKLVIARIA